MHSVYISCPWTLLGDFRCLPPLSKFMAMPLIIIIIIIIIKLFSTWCEFLETETAALVDFENVMHQHVSEVTI